MKALKERLLGTGGCVSGATSVLGSWQVCHNLCLGAIALLSILGITITGMPFLFLQNYAIPFWLIAVALLITTLILHLRGMKCISDKLLLLNSGLIIAGIPFRSLEGFSTSFYLIGGFLIVFSISLFIKDKINTKLYVPKKVIIPGIIILFLLPLGTQWFSIDTNTNLQPANEPSPEEKSNITVSSESVEQTIDLSIAKENIEGGVRITIKPTNITNFLSLEVSLDTHSVDLDEYNLKELAYLRDSKGNIRKPLSWESDGGGHHVSGFLKFESVDHTNGFEIIIENIGGVKQRVFKW